MNIKSEINIIQKRLLDRLNVRKGSTLFTIIQEISRQAFATGTFSVKQKNSTLAKKCAVTTSTISRNLKKLKTKCTDLITIEQDRNCEERFASLIFTFNCKANLQLENQMSNDLSNGVQTEHVKDSNKPTEVAENTSNSTTNPLDFISKSNKDLILNNVNKVQIENIIFDTYLEFKKQGIDKTLFNKVLCEINHKSGIKNFGAYLRGSLKKVVENISNKKSEENNVYVKSNYNLTNLSWHYDWIRD